MITSNAETRVDDDASLIANTISNAESRAPPRICSQVKAFPDLYIQRGQSTIKSRKGPEKADSLGTRRLSLFVTESILIFVQYHLGQGEKWLSVSAERDAPLLLIG